MRLWGFDSGLAQLGSVSKQRARPETPGAVPVDVSMGPGEPEFMFREPYDPATHGGPGLQRPKIEWLGLPALLMAALALMLAYSFATPLGEAPDEPAHLAYLERILVDGRVPAVPRVPTQRDYEQHQPPLAYVMTAQCLRWWPWPEQVIFPELPRAGDFDFAQPPKRYVHKDADLRGGWLPRLFNGLWILLFVPSLWWCVESASRPKILSFAVCGLFLFVPQLLFCFATFSNDAAAVALSTSAFALLVQAQHRRSSTLLVGAAACAGLALWAKLTAAFLFAPLLIVLVSWRRPRPIILAATLWLGFAATLLAYQASRGIPWGHAVPPGWGMVGGDPIRLLTRPEWIATLWLGSWAKLGWFNVHLPVVAYAWFLVPTVLIAVGAWWALRAREVGGLLALGAVALAVGFLMIYMVTSDWQPQGRLLLPAVGAFARLGAAGLQRIAPKIPCAHVWLAAVTVFGAVVISTLGLATLAWAY